MYQHTPSFLVDMKKRRTIRVLAILVFLVTILTGGWSFFTEYQIQQVRSEGGIALEVAGDEGIAHVSQSGYRVKKGDIGWYKRGDIANVKETTRTGYTFLGWYQDTTKVSDSNPYSHTMTAATKLVAKTKINSYRITAELDGGTINGSPSWSQTYTIKDTVTLPTPVKTGYNFLGWVEKGANNTPNKNVVIPVGSTGDKTYVAKWEIKKFEVDINGILDSGIIQNNTRGMGTFETYVNGVLAIRDNYYDYCDRAVPYGTEIEIKNIKAEIGRTYVKSSQSLKFTVTGNVSMTLQFKTNEYTYRFNANGGTGSMSDIKAKHGTSVKIPTSTFKKDYHTQTNWNTAAGGTGTSYKLEDTISGYSGKDGDVVTLYAQWRKNKVQISLHANGSKMGASAGSYFSLDAQSFVAMGGTRAIYEGEYGGYVTDSTNSLPDIQSTGNLWLERTGYHYNPNESWNTKSDGSGKSYSENGGILAKDFADLKDSDKSVTLYANWKPNNYKVRYNGNGATSGTMTDSAHVYDTTKVLTRNAYARTGYTFTGWNTKADGKGTAYANGASVKNLTATNDGIVTLYAQWSANDYTYEIQHWANGFKNQEGNNEAKTNFILKTDTYTEKYGSTYTLDSSKKTTIPNGFYLKQTFGTHSLSSDGSWTNYPFGTKVTQKDTKMKFEYDYIPNEYEITYNLNGGTNNSANPTSYTVLYGVSLKNPTRTGYTFDGWYNGSTKVTGINEGKNATFSSASELYSELAKRTTGDITLTAKWTPITYKNKIDHWAWGFTNNEGNNTDKNALKLGSTYFDAEYNSKYTMDSSLKTTIPNGFKFMSTFSTEAIDGVWKGYPIGTQVTQKSDSMRYEYGYQPITYKITYNLNGGTNNSSNPSYYNVLYGVSLKNPTRTGYTFDGWYNGSTKVTGINEGKTAWFTSADNLYQELASRKTGNITLEARWTLNKYTLSFNPNGGTVNPTSKTVSYGNPYGNLPTPTKKGSRFLGWFTEKDGGTQVSSTTTMGASNVTLYAHWNSIEYTVSFNASGEFGGLNKTYTSGQVLGLLPTPTKAGYTFLGWYYQDTSGNEVMATSQTVVTSHMELYARWEKVQEGDCTITITDNLTSGRGEYSVKINNGVAKEYSAGESFTCNKGDKIEVNACVPDLGAEPDLFDCTGPNGNSLMSGYTWRKVNRNTSILTGTVDKTGYISFYYRIIFAEEVIE